MELMIMDVKVLKYFLTVAREQSISRAAEVLHMTQPPLSRQLKDLETELGKQLFVRGNRRIILTESGVVLKKYAEEILELTEKAKEEVRSVDGDIRGELHFAAGETEHFALLSRCAAILRERYPGVSVHVYSGNSEGIVDRIDSGLVDFGLIVGVSDIERFDFLRLPVKDRWGLLVKDDDPLAEKEYITPDDLKGLPILISKQALDNREFAGWFKKGVDNLNVAGTYNLVYNASLMVKAGIGAMLCLEGLVSEADRGLKFIPLKPEFVSGSILVWKKGRSHSRVAIKFLEILQNEI